MQDEKRMRILFFSMWYSPEPVGKPHNLARELSLLGHTVTVFTLYPNYPLGKIFEEYVGQAPISKEKIDGVEVFRLWGYINRGKSALLRIIAMSSYSLFAFIIAACSFRKYDAVWTYQIGIPGLLYSFFTGTPHIHEIQDLWPAWGEGNLRGLQGGGAKLLLGVQRLICRQSSTVVTISDGFLCAARTQFQIMARKCRVLPNWSSSIAFTRKIPEEPIREKYGIGNEFVVTYGGNVGTAQGLEAIIEGAALLRDKKVLVVIAGDGVERARLTKKASQIAPREVKMLGGLVPADMSDLLSVSDALLITLAKDEKYSITIPSKTYSYFAMGKPVIAAATGDTAALINEIEAGISCEPENPKAFSMAILEMMAHKAADREAMGDRAYRASQGRFSGSSITREYSTIFIDCISSYRRAKH